jgi:glyoxylase-like metal-dependent hydrolase (beta-lactamase superfamily II)
MRKKLTIFILLLLGIGAAKSQQDTYTVFAIQFAGPFRLPVQQIAVGVTSHDSVTACYMIWLLKGANGRNVLVDAGFTDSARVQNLKRQYIRPDKVLKRLNINPEDISDIVLTHPHWDHIGGVDLFPNAKVWVQKADYNYFVGDAWQEDGFSEGFSKVDVKKIIDINLDGRLKFVNGENIEIIPGVRVFTGSRHTFESQYVLVNSNSISDRIIIASDNVWFYYNLSNLLPIPKYTFDVNGYVQAMQRMKTIVTNENLIIPGHDALVFKKFPKVADGIVRISN